jgi:hypothetical protein
MSGKCCLVTFWSEGPLTLDQCLGEGTSYGITHYMFGNY